MLLEPRKPGSLKTLRAWLKPGFNFLVAICQTNQNPLVNQAFYYIVYSLISLHGFYNQRTLVMLVEPPQLSCTPYIGAGKLILSQRSRSGETKGFNFQNSIGVSTVA